MQPGKLRHRGTIQVGIESQDAAGQIRTTWQNLHERVNCEVLPDRAGEFFAAQQVQSTTNALIRLRHVDGITPKMRFVHHLKDQPPLDEYWDIEGVVPFQSRFRELRLMCLKRDAEGYRRGEDLEN
jgi:SPP1 family predicted phage head-tail adaptor